MQIKCKFKRETLWTYNWQKRWEKVDVFCACLLMRMANDDQRELEGSSIWRVGSRTGKIKQWKDRETHKKNNVPKASWGLTSSNLDQNSFNLCKICLEVIHWYERYGNIFLDLRRRERLWNSSWGEYNRGKTLETKACWTAVRVQLG